MWKNRTAYITLMLLAGGLLFFFAKPMFAWILMGLLLLTVALLLCLWRDVRQTSVRLTLFSEGEGVGELRLRFQADGPRRFLALGSIWVEVQVRSTMFHTVASKRFLLTLGDTQEVYEVLWKIPCCGEFCVHCESLRMCDLLKLFSLKGKPFADERTICYPAQPQVSLDISCRMTGTNRQEGFLQNRKGNDPSEMFDIREYVPGDDIRAIHWKLSSKTEKLILREASEPSHYDVAILPDFGRNQWGQPLTEEEGTAAVALAIAIAEQLVAQGQVFCILLPLDSGLHICEVGNERQLQQVVSSWLSLRIQENAGNGLQFFRMEHLEERFTRLMILSAGRYNQTLDGIESRIGVTILSVVSGLPCVRTEESTNCYIAEFPTGSAMESCHVIC